MVKINILQRARYVLPNGCSLFVAKNIPNALEEERWRHTEYGEETHSKLKVAKNTRAPATLRLEETQLEALDIQSLRWVWPVFASLPRSLCYLLIKTARTWNVFRLWLGILRQVLPITIKFNVHINCRDLIRFRGGKTGPQKATSKVQLLRRNNALVHCICHEQSSSMHSST